jgi:hypothetical protein
MDLELTRREFLEVTAAVGLGALSDSNVSRDLTLDERSTLVAVIRSLFPDHGAGDLAYTKAAETIQWRCARDATVFNDITQGMRTLESACGGRLDVASDSTRVALVRANINMPSIQALYREILEGLFGSPDAWGLWERSCV